MDDEDRHHYRRLLREACLENDIAVHAFVLMDNHVHLLLTPARPQALAIDACCWSKLRPVLQRPSSSDGHLVAW
ncbi:transposase [Stenotrophomonas acidaminiphila]|uniref:transposase n=1 Tax=Stenotrophomonas acidaminiphila TaxID=128780 RepID=UPI00240661D8|nr:transposase [Stenotrophomonas acidaminiphila]